AAGPCAEADQVLDSERRRPTLGQIDRRPPSRARFAGQSARSWRPGTGTEFDLRGRMFVHAMSNAAIELARDMRIAVRSLLLAKGLAATVIITLGLGIGANAAIFSVVRGVLLRPLVNRDEDRLIYIRQTAPGVGIENYTFSMPEVYDFKNRATTIA